MKVARFAAILLLLSANLVGCDNSVDRVAPAPVIPDGIMAKDAAWEVLTTGHLYSDSPVADGNGNIYFAEGLIDSSKDFVGRITKLDTNLQPEVFFTDTTVTQGLALGADNQLYACRPQEAQIVRYSADGTYEVLAQGARASATDPGAASQRGGADMQYCNDIAVNADGGVWFTDRNSEQVVYVSPTGDVRTVASGFRGNGIQLSLDKKMLVVTDSRAPKLHAFRVSENGSLAELPDFFEPLKLSGRKPDVPAVAGGTEWSSGGSEQATGANGMTIDSEGRFYVTTFLGVQILDKNGRHLGTIPGADGYMSNLGFGGADRNWLYATGTQLSRLRTEARGAVPRDL